MQPFIQPPSGDLEARSPWSVMDEAKEVLIGKSSAPIRGDIIVPGSKSLTNRALIMAALAEGTTRIEGLLRSDDSYWCIQSLKQLGIAVKVEGDTAMVEGCGSKWPHVSGEIYVGAAGTVARFLPAALAASMEGFWTLTGSKRMSERPIGPLLKALEEQGAGLTYGGAERCLPFTLQAHGLKGGNVTLPGSTSSQFISGLLLAAPYAAEPLVLHIEGEVVQREYVEMTLEMMLTFGISPEVSSDGSVIAVPKGTYRAQDIQLEPDVSTCGYFWSLAALTGGRIRTVGIHADSTRQPDIMLLGVLERMGCTVIKGNGFVEVQGPERLEGGFELSMRECSDQTLTVAALAPFASGPISLKDVAHIRHHECDRIAVICTELRKLGLTVKEAEDGLTVYPGVPAPALLDSHDDHRMAMSLSLIGMMSGDIRISNPGCVSKTCPDYFDRLIGLGLDVQMR
ncbi:3-phosphoshikimate 1-carboxyvinyltransferase [Paenibacillus chungangensis]|uniref:3-phosphoshikimate 1-carboxyvinyltransferase n=1 Tax=Paenibacillus chungangensis TaxID=696535 RepID=A0ABW3HKU9_9BACL